MNLPVGYRYSAVYAGIRRTTAADLSLIVSDTPASAAAVFTRNIVQASPLRLSRKHLAESGGKVSAILINAGNANCATRTGDRVALATARAIARRGGWPVNEVIPASTGVIGVELDAALITDALPALFDGLAPERFEDVSRAIMTTDTVPKTAAAEVHVGPGTVRIAGMTKGSGMIHPNMATTLAFVMTDAAIGVPKLKSMLRDATDRSFNCLSVDGDTSTNDIIVLLANGASALKPAAGKLQAFEEAMNSVLESLARQIAADGEGARKCITIDVSGARDHQEARKIARAIANSPLVKTAIAGSDPNWGRILTAAGYSGAKFDPNEVEIRFQNVRVCRRGLAVRFDEDDLKSRLGQPDVAIRFTAGKGTGEARFWTCDLTEGYIEINGSYRT